jgi:hypothetical protein
MPASASFPPTAILSVGNKQTTAKISDLGLKPGTYDAALGDQKIKLLLVDSSRRVRRFGVRHGSLEYNLPAVTGKGTTAPWGSLWKTAGVPDIVVDFNGPYKFIFWRGMSYAPSWAMDNVMTSLFFAETVRPGAFRDCCEMMSDRECRYSHARVISASDARIVIHWRCALADPAYTICQNLWADEIFYIYPDGTAARNVTIHLDPENELLWQICPTTGRKVPCSMIKGPRGKKTFNDMEFITVNPPGATSDDVTPLDALTLLDTDAFSQTYHWPDPQFKSLPKLKDYIFRMNYKNRPAVFVASTPPGLQVCLQKNSGMKYEAGALVQDDRWTAVANLPSNFADHIHWPITRGYGTTPLTDPAQYQDRPTHTFLGYANNAPVDVTDSGDVTWTWFCGMAPDDDNQLRARVKSWSNPAIIEHAAYLPGQAAYLIEDSTQVLAVEKNRPTVRPTFLLNNFDAPNLTVLVDGKPSTTCAVGVEYTLCGTQTVVTFKQDLPPGSTVQFKKEAR